MAEIVVNRYDERRDALEGPAPDPLTGDLAEPALHEVEPGTAGGNAVRVHAGMASQPSWTGGLLCVLKLSRITWIA